MSNWKSAKAKRVLAALEKVGWQIKRQKGSHKTLSREAGRIMFSRFTTAKKSAQK